MYAPYQFYGHPQRHEIDIHSILGIGSGVRRDFSLVTIAFKDFETKVALQESKLMTDRATGEVQFTCRKPKRAVSGNAFDCAQCLNRGIAFDSGPLSRCERPLLPDAVRATFSVCYADLKRGQPVLEEGEMFVRHSGIGTPAICCILRHSV